MANLTLAIDDAVLKRARIRALEQGTSVNALVRDYLVGFGGESGAERGMQAFLEIAERSEASSPAGGRTWTREELHDRSPR